MRWVVAAALADSGDADAALDAMEASAPSHLRALDGWLRALRAFGPAARRLAPLLEGYARQLEADTTESAARWSFLVGELAHARERLGGES